MFAHYLLLLLQVVIRKIGAPLSSTFMSVRLLSSVFFGALLLGETISSFLEGLGYLITAATVTWYLYTQYEKKKRMSELQAQVSAAAAAAAPQQQQRASGAAEDTRQEGPSVASAAQQEVLHPLAAAPKDPSSSGSDPRQHDGEAK